MPIAIRTEKEVHPEVAAREAMMRTLHYGWESLVNFLRSDCTSSYLDRETGKPQLTFSRDRNEITIKLARPWGTYASVIKLDEKRGAVEISGLFRATYTWDSDGEATWRGFHDMPASVDDIARTIATQLFGA